MRHLLDFQDVNKNHLENLIEESRSLKIISKNLDTLALLKFDEPSTRTRLSFAIAAEKLGIKGIRFTNPVQLKEELRNLEIF